MQNFIFLILIAACFLTAGCPAPCEIEDAEVTTIHADTEPIIAALETFRGAEKKYPRSLSELAPRYLDKIPEKVGGRKFSYIWISDGNYNLRVYSPSGGSYSGSCAYSEIADRWEYLNRAK